MIPEEFDVASMMYVPVEGRVNEPMLGILDPDAEVTVWPAEFNR